jgi:hypothetical protein
MPRFYFHLSNSKEVILDKIGSEVFDLAAAHSKAARLADRIIGISDLTDFEPDLRRWTVQVADQNQQPVVTLIFSACSMAEKRKPIMQIEGAHGLQEYLDETLCK